MKTFRLILAAGLLTGAAVSAQADPHWSAYIGTGRALDAHPVAVVVTASRVSPAGSADVVRPYWTAFIGTGRVSAYSALLTDEPRASGSAVAHATLHWTSHIGTGHAFEESSAGSAVGGSTR